MDRRDFFKIVSTASTGIVSGGCGKKAEHLLPLLISEPEIPTGEEMWQPGVCGECEAGCGIIARVMEAERVVERHGQKYREKISAIKKIEGNPLDPVSGGRLCARGQAAVQGLYHPDRLRGPMRRKGHRGVGEFEPITWEQALPEVTARLRHADRSNILYLGRPRAGTRGLAVSGFLQALGAPPPVSFEVADFPIERRAAQDMYGWAGLPVYDLGNAVNVISIGVDFLGAWTSPVFYARQFGHFRQGRPNVRGKLVHAESRFSVTAQSADEWLPLRPGTELQFALALGHLLIAEKLARATLPQHALPVFEAADVSSTAHLCGIDEQRLRQAARELGESDRPLVVAGASIPHTNSIDAVKGAMYLNFLLGNVGKPGGVLLRGAQPTGARPAYTNALARLERAAFLFLDGANPAYTLPRACGIEEKLRRVETIIAFSSFLDDSTAYADYILPDHHSLETAAAVFPDVVSGAAIATPFVQPLSGTRATEDVLGELAATSGIEFSVRPVKSLLGTMLPAEQEWDSIAPRGGWWDEAVRSMPTQQPNSTLETSMPTFHGNSAHFPLHFLPYLSLQFHDGRSSNLPWMQELPDPVSSAIWSLPVEIDPGTAAKLGINTGDKVQIESAYGKLEAPAYVDPAAIPGVVSMAIGQGHRYYSRYASNRGANPISILAPAWEQATGALALGATRVRLTRLGKSGGLIQFAAVDREHGPWGYR
jgi:anaerobic selenocysteine-containing dehydrogenase